MSTRLYIIAGEASGDLHGSNLAKALRTAAPDMELRGWGGDKMEDAGVEIVKHYRDLAFMGFIEVVMNLRTILGNIKACKADIEAYKPDLIVFIDYPGFNLRIAEWAHENGIKTFYYISPQIWAWKQNRVHKIKKVVDKMAVILPFEKEFYARFDYDVSFVGHPLLDVIGESAQQGKTPTAQALGLDERPIIALLPGSRQQEIKKMLPIMLKVGQSFSDYQLVVAGAPSQPESFYREVLGKNDAHIIFDQTYGLFQLAKAGMVTSGTATLEAALFGMPEVVCYRGSAVSYQIAKRLIKVKYISLVNLIMDREIVTELIQKELNYNELTNQLKALLEDKIKLEVLKKDYTALRSKLGDGGASARTADEILTLLKA